MRLVLNKPKKYIIIIDKLHLITILKLFSSEETFEALDKKYSTTIITYFYQLCRNYQAIYT